MKSTNPMVPKLKGIAKIFDGKALIGYDNGEFTKSIYQKMKKDGKKVNYTRGVIYEFYEGKKEDEILDLMIESIKQTKTEIEEAKLNGHASLPYLQDLKAIDYEVIK